MRAISGVMSNVWIYVLINERRARGRRLAKNSSQYRGLAMRHRDIGSGSRTRVTLHHGSRRGRILIDLWNYPRHQKRMVSSCQNIGKTGTGCEALKSQCPLVNGEPVLLHLTMIERAERIKIWRYNKMRRRSCRLSRRSCQIRERRCHRQSATRNIIGIEALASNRTVAALHRGGTLVVEAPFVAVHKFFVAMHRLFALSRLLFKFIFWFPFRRRLASSPLGLFQVWYILFRKTLDFQ